MFVLTDHITVTRDVKIPVPVDGNKFETKVVKIKYMILNQNEHEVPPTEAEIAAAAALNLPAPQPKGLSYAELLRMAIVGWPDGSMKASAAPDAEDVPFSTEAREKLINLPYALTPLVTAYFEAAAGAKTKN